MARHLVSYSCGCGVNTKDPAKAIVHCDSTGHIMTVSGTMAPDILRQKGSPKITAQASGGASNRELDDLRKKFMK